MNNNTANEAQILWQDYIRKPAFKKRLAIGNFRVEPPADYQNIEVFISKMAGHDFDSAKPGLKAVMTPAAFSKLCDAYRAYTYKLRHGRKNVSLSAETLARLKPIASRLGLQEPGQGIDGGLDNLLYYLTSPEEQDSVQPHLTALARDKDWPQPTPMLKPEIWLSLLKQRLPAPEQNLLLQVLEKAFTQGWQAREQAKTPQKLQQLKNDAKIIKAFHGENKGKPAKV
ncbi:hypothetical protein SG34_030795 [Thalassomonas viridans]|uniref:Uncharacterized protein n=1 Tax=Thalassomonas viridans TaxID=137584 RepID=A0AAE9ZAI2_9GAMM|nr:hypothetical protein [Thalassomonas viridans]WDE09157.1 hypothetical protein SG34_030795 [Thalassomonas viridans]